MDFKYQGIILGKKDVGETDRIYTVYTKEAGKIKARAIGVRRPNAKLAGHLEPLTYAEIFVAKTRGTGKITGAIAIGNFLNIKSDLESLNQAAYAFKALEKIITDQEKDENIFELLLDYLTVLEKLSGSEDKNGKKMILTMGFLFKLLDESGYKLQIEKCVNCGTKLKPKNNFMSYPNGGILCPACKDGTELKISVENNSIKFMRIFSKNRIKNFTKLSADEKDLENLQKIIDGFLMWIAK